MVSAAKAFAKEPPREPLTSLDAIVRDFQWRYVERKKTDQVIKYCAEAPNLRDAIDRAVRARDENGKHHNHQSKVDLGARMVLGKTLTDNRKALRRCADFDALHDFIDENKPYGIGPVTVYDVAVRVGAWLDLEPMSVYMHAGVRQGFKALQAALDGFDHDGTDKFTDPFLARYDRIPIEWFPTPLGQMRADDVEDILCTYREVFDTWHSD
jgi:hypothetical protein